MYPAFYRYSFSLISAFLLVMCAYHIHIKDWYFFVYDGIASFIFIMLAVAMNYVQNNNN